MKFSIILLCSFSFVAAVATTNLDNYLSTCPYEKTVDLTNLKPYPNGSYVYQDVLIPIENQSFYDYDLIFGNGNRSVVPHRRGCVCDNPKICIKLCCEKNKFYNLTSNECEDFETPREFKWELKIRLRNFAEKTVNIFQQFIYQVDVPCEERDAIIGDKDKWILLENGDIFMHVGGDRLSTLNYCLTPYKQKETQEYLLTPLSCPMPTKWDVIVTYYGMAISVFFYIPTIVVYLMIKKLRKKIRGKILICYLISITTVYSIISFIMISGINIEFLTCQILGFVIYFSLIAGYSWLSVLCFDIWNTIRKSHIYFYSKNDQKLFLYYSLVAWGSAAVFTGITLFAELFPYSPEIIKPNLGADACWPGSVSGGNHFFDIIRVLVIVNFSEFLALSVYICAVYRKIGEFTQQDQKNAKVMLGLFLILDFFAIIDILTFAVPLISAEWLLIFANLTIALRGPLIFIFFIFNGYVLNLLKEFLQ